MVGRLKTKRTLLTKPMCIFVGLHFFCIYKISNLWFLAQDAVELNCYKNDNLLFCRTLDVLLEPFFLGHTDICTSNMFREGWNGSISALSIFRMFVLLGLVFSYTFPFL